MKKAGSATDPLWYKDAIIYQLHVRTFQGSNLGVDALRMDAIIPYLVERDGTTCESLPETHHIIKTIRTAIDADYTNRLTLAEANQWPADVRPYFGNGGEETVLCVANLSSFAQPISLDLSAFAGLQPVKMLDYVPFPPSTDQPYPLTLAPYSFFWLEFEPTVPKCAPVKSNSTSPPLTSSPLWSRISSNEPCNILIPYAEFTLLLHTVIKIRISFSQ